MSAKRIWAFQWILIIAGMILKLLLRKTFLGLCFIFDKTDTGFYDYIPKTQAEKMYTFAKEQMDIVKTGAIFNNVVAEEINLKI
jgi:hypothetical protein